MKSINLKRYALPVLLTVSMLLNVAGLVFFILFLNTEKRLKDVKNERNHLAQNLAGLQASQIARDADLDKRRVRTFVSHFDGAQDAIVIAPKEVPPLKAYQLVVYLHGMGHTCLEPFTSPKGHPIADAIIKSDPSIIILSCNYRRQAAWASDGALSDISQNIREVCQQFPINRIAIVGCSMGGCVSLIYATLAPQDIKEKLAGVVSLEGAGDMASLYSQTNEPTVRYALQNCFGGNPDQSPATYAAKSFIKNVGALPPTTRVAVISAREDKVVPPSLQADIIKALDGAKITNKLLPIDGDHHMPDPKVIVDGLRFVLSGSLFTYRF
jgi:acetyl esterase/lipase